jgi:predicted Zn-dependent protease
MKNHDELAGLIAHEVSHVNNRHSMKMLCRNLSGYLFISVVLTDVNGIMAVIGDNVHNLQSLSYSRQFEKQADIEGVELMIENKINPKGMTNLFKRIQKNDVFLLPEFLSSHPITQDRIDYINDLIIEKPHQTLKNQKLENLFNQIKN